MGIVRPRVSAGEPEMADVNVCPLLVGGPGDVPRSDTKDVNDRAVAPGVLSRLANAFSLDLIRLCRLVGPVIRWFLPTSAGFMPVGSDCMERVAETAVLDPTDLRMLVL